MKNHWLHHSKIRVGDIVLVQLDMLAELESFRGNYGTVTFAYKSLFYSVEFEDGLSAMLCKNEIEKVRLSS